VQSHANTDSCCRRQKVNTTTTALGLWVSFVNEKNMSRKELHETVQMWVNIEEDEFVIAEEVIEALADLNSDVVQVTPDGECNMNNAEDRRQQAQHERDTSPMDHECTLLPTDAGIKEMCASIKQHLVHEKEDELVRKLETVQSQHHQNKLARGTHQASISSFFKPK